MGNFSHDIDDKDLNNLYKNLNRNNFIFQDWETKHSSLIKFLNTFDKPIKLLMWILLFLSIYSLSSLIFNFLIERKQDLKILYCIGLSKRYMQYLVVSISLYISVISIIIGSMLSLVIMYIQNEFKIIKFPSEEIFHLKFLPAHIDSIYFIKYPVLLLITTFIISLFLSIKNIKTSNV